MRCNECRRNRETESAQRFGGGTYRRPGRLYASQICRECVEELIGLSTPGVPMVLQWNVGSLKRTLKRFEEKASS